MDILLIYPPTGMAERYGKKSWRPVGGHLPPFGLACLAAVIREAGFRVHILDAPACGMTDEDILAAIREFKPKAIGFSALTYTLLRTVQLSDKIRETFPETLILIGGHHPSIAPADTLKNNPSLDLAIYGEGERTIVEILRAYQTNDFNRNRFLSSEEALRRIQGMAFREQATIRVAPPRPLIENLDELPFPAWDLLPLKKYVPLPNQYLQQPVLSLIAMRGCPFGCTYCSTNAVFGHKLRALSPGRLVKIIQYAQQRFGTKEISFWDDTFTFSKKWLLEFCAQIKKAAPSLSWTCYSRVDTVDPELLKEMKSAGCWNIFYGYESGHQNLLDRIDKRISLDKIRQVNQWTKDAGIEVRAAFMLALPGETPEMAEQTIDFAISLEPDYAQFTITTPHPGTTLFQKAQEFGNLSPDWMLYNHWAPAFVPHGYKNEEEIRKIHRRAFRRFYLRPRYIWGRLKKIRSVSDLIRYLKGFWLLFVFIRK